MDEKPNASSVTATPCTCGYLEREAAETSNPIQFDARMQEYQIACSGGGHLVIYHCPSCGGAAPCSQRHREFAFLTWDEIHRLEELTSSVRSVEEAVDRFGPPAYDHERGLTVHMPAAGSDPERAESFRTLTFTNLSDTADVVLVDYGVRGVKWQYGPKHLGTGHSEV